MDLSAHQALQRLVWLGPMGSRQGRRHQGIEQAPGM